MRSPTIADTYRPGVRPPAVLLVLVLALTGCSDVISDTFDYGAVEVTATRRSGEPVAGTEVILFTGQRVMDRDTTGAAGTHRFEFVPNGIYGVFATPPDGFVRPEELVGGPSTATKAGLELEEGDEVDVEFTYLKRGPGAIQGTTTEPDGTPVPGVPMTLFEPGRVVARDTTDASGSVLFEPVAFGNYGVSVEPPPLYREAESVPPVVADGLIVEEGVTDVATFRLDRCEGVITGRVLDETGDPVEGMAVELFGSRGSIEAKTTGSDGLATFEPVLCRDRGIRLRPTPGLLFTEGRGSSFFDGIRVSSGFRETFTFTVERCYGNVEVVVVDGAGEPVGDAGLELYSGTGVVETLSTSSDGGAAFERVPCGPPYGVRVLPPEGFSVEEGRGSSFIDGIEIDEENTVQLRFTLQRVE